MGEILENSFSSFCLPDLLPGKGSFDRDHVCRQAVLKQGVWMMRHFKVLLQLHSLKLIIFCALAVVLLAMTTATSSNETQNPQIDVSSANESANRVAVANSETTKVKKRIE